MAFWDDATNIANTLSVAKPIQQPTLTVTKADGTSISQGSSINPQQTLANNNATDFWNQAASGAILNNSAKKTVTTPKPQAPLVGPPKPVAPLTVATKPSGNNPYFATSNPQDKGVAGDQIQSNLGGENFWRQAQGLEITQPPKVDLATLPPDQQKEVFNSLGYVPIVSKSPTHQLYQSPEGYVMNGQQVINSLQPQLFQPSLNANTLLDQNMQDQNLPVKGQGFFGGTLNALSNASEKALHPVAKILLGFVSQPLNYTKGLTDIYSEEQISNKIASGELPESAQGVTGVFNKSALQWSGDIAGTALLLGGYATGMFTKASTALETPVEMLTGKQIATNIAKSFGSNVLNSLPYAVTMSASGGTNPLSSKGLIQTAANTAILATFGTALENTLPLTKWTVAKTKEFQTNFEQSLIKQGVPPQEAHLMATQGGFLGNKDESNPFNAEQVQPESPNQKERGFITSVKENPATAEDIAKQIEGTYNVHTDKEAVSTAQNLIATDRPAAERLAMSDTNSKDANTTGILLLREANDRYKTSGDIKDLQEAQQLAEHLAKKGTAAGQAVQSFSLLKKKLENPESALVEANKYIESQNRKVAPKIKDNIETVTGEAQGKITEINKATIERIIKETPELQSKPETDLEKIVAKKEYPPEEMLANKISVPGDLKKAPDPVKDMVNTLYKIAKQDLPTAGKLVPRDPIELISQALKDKDTYKDIYIKAQEVVRERYSDNPKALEALDEYLGRKTLSGETVHGDLPVAKSQITAATKAEMKAQNIDLGQVVREHYTSQDAARKSLADKIAEKTGAPTKDAMFLARKIETRFNELASEKKASILKQMFADRKVSASKGDIQKIIEMTNLGAFDKAELRNQIGNKLGLSSLTETDAKIIVDRANAIQQMKDGPEKSYQKSLLALKIHDLTPSSLVEKGIAVWKAGLVSALPTKLIKAGSEFTFQGMVNTKDVVATGVDKLAYLVTGVRTKSASLGGLVEQYRAIKPGAVAAKDYFTYGAGSGMYDHFKTVLERNDIHDFGRETKFENPYLDLYVSRTFRFLGAETKIYQEMGLKASLYEQARVQALNEGKTGLELKSRVKELYSTPTDQMAMKAIDEADYRTFQNDNALSSAVSSLKQNLKNNSPVGYAIAEGTLPFQKVPINIGKAALVDYTPFGIVKAGWEQIRPETRGQAQLVETLSKSITGSSVIVLGAWLGAKGLMTGSYPTSKVERDQWAAEGKQANSILIGGRWYQLGRVLGPTGELLGLGADINNLSQDNHGIALAYKAAIQGVKKTGEQPFLLGASQTLQGIQNPDVYGQKFVEGTVGSLVPNIITRLTKSIDTTQRDPQGLTQQVESRIPFLSKTLPAKRDLFGQPITNPGDDSSFFDPFMSRPNQPSPILDEANRIGASITQPDKTLFNTKLDNKEYGTYMKVQGTVIKAGVGALIESDEYKKLSPSDQKTAFESTVRDLRKQVDAAVFPNLMIKRYNLPTNTSPDLINNIFSLLGQNAKFKRMNVGKQNQVVQKIFNAKH